MKHKHHIVPRHMGGTDEPSNIIEVSLEEHAELHFSLYLEYGKIEDWLAYNGLAGLMQKKDIEKVLSEVNSRSAYLQWETMKEYMTQRIGEGKRAPAARKKTSDSMKQLYTDPNERNKRSTKLKEYYATEEGKQKKQEAIRKAWESRPRKQQKMSRSEAQRVRREREQRERG